MPLGFSLRSDFRVLDGHPSQVRSVPERTVTNRR